MGGKEKKGKDTKTEEPWADSTTESAAVAWESMVVLRMNRKVSPVEERCLGALVVSPVMMVMQEGKEAKLFVTSTVQVWV